MLLIIPADGAFCLSVVLAEKSVKLPEAFSHFSYMKAPGMHREDPGPSVPVVSLWVCLCLAAEFAETHIP